MKHLLLMLCLLSLNSFALSSSYQQVVVTEFGGPEVMKMVTQQQLPEPGPDEIRIKVLTASASFTDVMVRKGMYAGAPSDPPLVPGYDLVGIVDKLGEGVSDFELGQRVAALTVWGAYTEYAVRPISELVVVPDGLDEEQAVALILSYTTAYQMLHRSAKVKPGQTILIHGASGAVGTALAQLGKVAGVNMIGTASTGKQDYIKSLGVEAIDYKTEDFVERTMALTANKGVDVVFDAISVDNFKRSYETLNGSGHLVVYGFYNASLFGEAGGMGDILGEFLSWQWKQWMWRLFPDDEKTVDFYSITDMRDEHPKWYREDVTRLFSLANGRQISPMVWKTLPLSDAAQAHQLIEDRVVKGKIILRVSR